MAGTPRRTGMLALAVLVGAVLYAGAGFSMRATDEPRFCGSCHMMREAARTHQKSPHAKQACNECHLPQTMGKLPAKAAYGLHDAYANTLGTVADVIHATPDTRAVVNANCKRCHAMSMRNVAEEPKQLCTDCHRHTPHLGKRPVAERRVADE